MIWFLRAWVLDGGREYIVWLLFSAMIGIAALVLLCLAKWSVLALVGWVGSLPIRCGSEEMSGDMH